MCHVCPFHRSTKVVSVPEALTESPTAAHADGAVQDTPASELTLAPAGFGVRWPFHLWPFHLSARVTPTFEMLICVPTAMHDEALAQVPNSS
jgi:hypothetical protein